jgi:CubicO group peptidase (beta-lactamase class C family)
MALPVPTGTIDDLLAHHVAPGEPGIAVGVYADGRLVDAAAAGYASVEHRVPVMPRTVFDIASVSKQFVATCILLLEQDGLLSVEDDLRDHLPGMHLRHRVTLRQCAQHTAGLRDYMATTELVGGGPECWRHEDAIVRMLRAQRDTDFAPGSHWSYSNTGYIALAAVVRRVSGRPLADFAAERVLGPLNMTTSRFQDDGSAIVPDRAGGYRKDDEGFHRADSLDSAPGDGGLLTTVTDLARWHAFLASGDVLGEPIRDRLLSRAVLSDGRTIRYALGIEHQIVAGHPAVGHGGAIDGFRADFVQLLDEPLGVAVLANRSDGQVARIARTAVAVALALDENSDHPAVRRSRPGSQPDGVEGLWYSATSDTFIEARVVDAGRMEIGIGELSIAFVLGNDGEWAAEGLGVDIRARVAGDELALFEYDGPAELADGDDGDVGRYVRVQRSATTTGGADLVGRYYSAELTAMAQVDGEPSRHTLTLGLGRPVPLEVIADDLYRTPSHTVHVLDGGTALSVSTGRARGIRFDRLPADVRPLGVPLCLQGAQGQVEPAPLDHRSA